MPIPYVEEVFVTPEDAVLFCLEAEDGEIRWHNQRIERILAVSQDRVYGLDFLNNLVALSRKAGSPLVAFPVTDFTISTANQFTDRIYLGTKDGLIMCLHEIRNPAPLEHQQTRNLAKETQQRRSTTPQSREGLPRFDEGMDTEKAADPNAPAEGTETPTKRKSFFDF
jgi:hypothetical protein